MFAIDPRSLPSCRTYQEAVRVWENAHVAPKFSEGWRGLKNKRDDTKLVANDRGTIRFRLHDTDVVTWKPSECHVGFWDSQSTILFAEQFLPDGMTAIAIRGDMYIKTKAGVFMPIRGRLPFRQDDADWVPDPLNVHIHTHEVLDLKKAAAIRKIMKPYLDWDQAMVRLGVHSKMVIGTIFDRYRVIKESLVVGKVDPKTYRYLSGCAKSEAPDLHDCYILGRALTRVAAPLGARPKHPKYRSPAWAYV